MALGLMETPEIVKSGAAGIGKPRFMLVPPTGRDGGASFASVNWATNQEQNRPAVQVGRSL